MFSAELHKSVSRKIDHTNIQSIKCVLNLEKNPVKKWILQLISLETGMQWMHSREIRALEAILLISLHENSTLMQHIKFIFITLHDNAHFTGMYVVWWIVPQNGMHLYIYTALRINMSCDKKNH